MKQGERVVFPPSHVTDKKLPLLFCANKLSFRNGRGGLLSHKISHICSADNLRRGGGWEQGNSPRFHYFCQYFCYAAKRWLGKV